MRSMRELVARADAKGDDEFLVQGDRRLTYAEHNALVRRSGAALLGAGWNPATAWRCCRRTPSSGWCCSGPARRSGRPACRSTPGGRRTSWSSACATPAPACSSATRSAGRSWARSSAASRISSTCSSPGLDGVRRARRGPAAELLDDRRSGRAARRARRRGRPPRDPLHVGHDRRPKGATLTHRQAIANLQNIFCVGVATADGARRRPRRPGPAVTLLVVPLFHVTGCLSTMTLELRARARSSC